MVQTTPAFHPEGCLSGKETLQTAEQDQTRDSLQAGEPSPGLVWMITHAPALLHPSKVCSSLGLAMRTARLGMGVWRQLCSPQQPRAVQGHQKSWPELLMSAASSLAEPGLALQAPGMCLFPAPPGPTWGPECRKDPEPKAWVCFAPPPLCCSCPAGSWWEFPLDTQGFIHTQLETTKGPVLSSGSSGHENSLRALSGLGCPFLSPSGEDRRGMES